MTEYQLFGALFFGGLGVMIIIASIADYIQNLKRKREIKRLKRIQRRMDTVNNYAEFVAMSEWCHK